VTRKQKIPAKSFELAKQGQKRPSGIRLQDLMPKKRVTGGKGLLFGASESSQGNQGWSHQIVAAELITRPESGLVPALG